MGMNNIHLDRDYEEREYCLALYLISVNDNKQSSMDGIILSQQQTRIHFIIISDIIAQVCRSHSQSVVVLNSVGGGG
jgi:hypothetical protein